MKINAVSQNVKVLAKEATLSSDGKNTYYKLAVLVGAEAGNVSCSKEVYNLVETDKSYDLSAVFNSEYKTFKFEKVAKMPAMDKPPVK